MRQKLVKALGRDARAAVRRRARDRRRHRLLLAQPAAARGDRALDRDRHLARDAGDASGDRRAARARGRDGPHRGRAAAVRRRELRPRLRPRDPPPHPRPRARLLRVPPRPAPRRHARLLRRALALRRPDRGGAEARRRCSPRPPGAGCSAPRRRPGSTARVAATATSSRPRSTSTPSPPPSCATSPRGRLRRRPPARRGAARERLRLAAAHARVERRARGGADGLAALRLPQLHGAAARRHRRCSSRGCRPSSSTTWSSAPASRAEPAAQLRRPAAPRPAPWDSALQSASPCRRGSCSTSIEPVLEDSIAGAAARGSSNPPGCGRRDRRRSGTHSGHASPARPRALTPALPERAPAPAARRRSGIRRERQRACRPRRPWRRAKPDYR